MGGGGGTPMGGGGGAAICGNGIVQSGEQCDDGNTNNQTDGCRNCRIAPGFSCSGSPSTCVTTTLTIQNNTSFPIISMIVDGVEHVTVCNTGYLVNTAFTMPVTPNQPHTWSARNGTYDGTAACNKIFHESWGPATFTAPAGTYSQTLVNRSLQAYVNGQYTYSCWMGTYASTQSGRTALLRLNNGGSWTFRETRNDTGAVTRTASGTSWPETGRTVYFNLSYRIAVNATTYWTAQYDVGGGNYINNGITSTTQTARILYLRQQTSSGAPTNCP